MKETVSELLQSALAALQSEGTLPADQTFTPQIGNTKDKSHGDYACNIALMAAKAAGRPPRKLAEALVAALPESSAVEKVEIAGPGFINFFMSTASAFGIVNTILDEAEQFGRNNSGKGEKVQVEFVSANPTGPLHVGHGRGAAIGDCLCRLLEANGYDVTREFYYNDAGAQINNLALSVQSRVKGLTPEDESWPEDGYRGDYIVDVANAYLAGETVIADDREVTAKANPDDQDAIRDFAVAYLRREQDLDLQAFRVRFDQYYLESSLYTSGRVERAVAQLVAAGKTYEQDGALWLKSTDYGDDKDRVMKKQDGTYTYFVPDVAYHIAKWERGFHKVINIQGTDHHGTIARVRAGLQAVGEGIPEGYPDYVLHTMVRVTKGGEEVKISKRAGSYVTLRDLIEWTSTDAVRFFLLSRKPDTEYTFDVDLAVAQNNDNPVYYVQYAHARICSVLAAWGGDAAVLQGVDLSPLESPAAQSLMLLLAKYPEMLSAAAKDFAPHDVTFYLRELAATYHSYYDAERILVDDEAVKLARLALVAATAQVLHNGLAILGVTAPRKM